MSTTLEAVTAAAGAEPGYAADSPFSITSDQFQRMVDGGTFPEDARVYLWGGRIYEKMAKSLPHANVQSALTMALARRMPADLWVGPEHPVRLDDWHLPLPDLIVVTGGPLDFHDERFPDGRDVLLVVEVAVTSLSSDLGVRLKRYAATLPMAAYLVADVPHRRFLLHEGPGPEGFARRAEIGPGGRIELRLGTLDLAPIPFEEVMR